MKKRNTNTQRLDEEVQKTLQSLDSLEEIEAGPYFQTRLQLAIRDSEYGSFDWLFRLTKGYRLVPAGLLLFIALNTVSLVFSFSESHASYDTRSMQLQRAAHDYFSFIEDYENQIGAAGK